MNPKVPKYWDTSNHYFLFVLNGTLMFLLGVQIFKHIKVYNKIFELQQIAIHRIPYRIYLSQE